MNEIRSLTIAIPTFDRQDFLREALASIAKQTRKDLQVILFDNASPYDIEALMDEFSELDITLLRNQTNIGNQANFERVMSHIYNTPYVMIFHDDDTIHPQYLAEALDVLDRSPDVQWVGSIINPIHSGHGRMDHFRQAPEIPPRTTYTKRSLADAFMKDLNLGFSTVVYRRSVLETNHPQTTRFHKWLDRPYLTEAINEGTAVVFDFPFINYRLHGSQDSAQKYQEHIDQMINLIAYFQSIGSKNKTNRAFTTLSALRTALQNADSIAEFRSILRKFNARDLYHTRDISIRAIYWTIRLLGKRIYFLLMR